MRDLATTNTDTDRASRDTQAVHPPAVANPAPSSTHFGPILVDFDDRVLIPRPWTLQQAQWAAEIAASQDGTQSQGPILEVCAGAGHIGLAAAVLADRDLLQVELDPVAAAYARFNAARAGWSARNEVRQAPLQRALARSEEFGLILADPPYLPSAAVARWPEDPVRAIDGGTDGLDLIRDCLALAAVHLRAGGVLLLQVAGPAQADDVRNLLAGSPAWGLRSTDLRVEDFERAVLRIDRRP